MQTRSLKQHGYVYAGWASFGLGFVGMFLPLLPTTVFWILAAWLWARGNPELAARVFAHPHFGAPVRAFLEHGVISAKGKWCAVSGMSASYLVLLLVVRPAPLTAGLVGLILLAVAVWILSRPQHYLITAS